MGIQHGIYFFAALSVFVCCSAQWDNVNFKGNLQQQPWYPSQRWAAPSVEQRNLNTVNKPSKKSTLTHKQYAQQNALERTKQYGNNANKIYPNIGPMNGHGPSYSGKNTGNAHNINVPESNPKYSQTTSNPLTDIIPPLNQGQLSNFIPPKIPSALPKLKVGKGSGITSSNIPSIPSVLQKFSLSNHNIGPSIHLPSIPSSLPTLRLDNHNSPGKANSDVPVLTVNTPRLSHQIVGHSIVNTRQNGDGPRDFISKQRIHKVKNLSQPLSLKGGIDSKQDSYESSLPADVLVSGDPEKDNTLGVKVQTPNKIYDVQLERISNNILHEDVRFLTVSVDKNGKTIFKEQFKTVDLQAKAKEMNYFHDLQTGTFLSVKAVRKNSGEKPKNFIEGVLYDELIVAAPHHQKRHKRALFKTSHTVYKKDSGSKGAFHFDTVEVPNVEEMMQSTKPHIRKKRQFRTSSVGVPPRHSQSRSQEVRTPLRIEPELLLFVDFALFREFEGDSNELLEYLLHFWHAVNWKYLTIALAGSWPVIDLKIREIGVFKEPNAQPFIESSRIRRGSKLFSLYDAMDNLQKWLIRYENALPIHDVAFLQTGENACRRVKHNDNAAPFNPPSILKTLRRGINVPVDSKSDSECVTGTAGVAYVRGACLSAPMLRGNAFNFGIGEASNSFNGVIIAAHEVGHLLGAYHDGEADAGICSPKSGYIMSYTRDDSYKFSRFSECSIRSFQNFLRMDRAKCLLQRSSRDTLKFPTTFPGRFMSLRQQCLRFTGGPPCEEGPAQCEHLCCDDRKGEWRYTRSEPAVDGTECSNMKVCLNGQCVPLATIGK